MPGSSASSSTAASTTSKKRRLLTTDFDPVRHDTGTTDDGSDEREQVDEGHYTVERIRTAMRNLSEGYRVVLSLYLFEGYDHEEISQILGISVGTSKSQYSRARKRLAALLSTTPN